MANSVRDGNYKTVVNSRNQQQQNIKNTFKYYMKTLNNDQTMNETEINQSKLLTLKCKE